MAAVLPAQTTRAAVGLLLACVFSARAGAGSASDEATDELERSIVGLPSLADVRAARERCHADPDAVVEDAVVTRLNGLRVNCDPEHEFPPCISEAFFHTKSRRALSWEGVGGGPRDYAVCKRRRRYADWPTVDTHVPLSRRPGDGTTRRAEDVARLLGPKRTVLIIGASTARQLHDASLCALASAPGNFSDVRRRWRMHSANKYREASGGCTRGAAARACLARNLTHLRASSPVCAHHMIKDRCYANGTGFQKLLDETDVVVAAFDPQHYGGAHVQERDWANDMTYLFAELSRWLERHAADRGKAAFVREGAALHFVGGEYRKPKRAALSEAEAGPPKCECVPARNAWAFKNKNWRATAQLLEIARRHPRVHVLPFYNATLKRHDMHKGNMCAFRLKRVNGVAEGGGAEGGARAPWARPAAERRRLAARPIRKCCDCLHLCYSPAFYDAVFFSPMYAQLVARHGYSPR